jgi:hypothetical protein
VAAPAVSVTTQGLAVKVDMTEAAQVFLGSQPQAEVAAEKHLMLVLLAVLVEAQGALEAEEPALEFLDKVMPERLTLMDQTLDLAEEGKDPPVFRL